MDQNGLPRRIAYYVIAGGFLVYGGLRLAGGLPAIAQVMGWADTEVGRGVLEMLTEGLPEMSQRAIVPLSIPAYIAWSTTMGVVLTIGALLALFKRRIGYWLMGLFFVMFAWGFVNFMVINAKFLHFAAALLLFLLMLWLSKERNATPPA